MSARKAAQLDVPSETRVKAAAREPLGIQLSDAALCTDRSLEDGAVVIVDRQRVLLNSEQVRQLAEGLSNIVRRSRLARIAPGERSAAVIAANALGPWDVPEPLPFAIEALRQLAAELSMLGSALGNHKLALDDDEIARAISGLTQRARSAAELVDFLGDEQGGAS